MLLDEQGGHYYRHVWAMTGEKLHSKSDIAAELAYRDWRIAELQAQIIAMQPAQVPEPGSLEINEAVWRFIEALPDGALRAELIRSPDIKIALHSAVSSLLAAAPQHVCAECGHTRSIGNDTCDGRQHQNCRWVDVAPQPDSRNAESPAPSNPEMYNTLTAAFESAQKLFYHHNAKNLDQQFQSNIDPLATSHLLLRQIRIALELAEQQRRAGEQQETTKK